MMASQGVEAYPEELVRAINFLKEHGYKTAVVSSAELCGSSQGGRDQLVSSRSVSTVRQP